MLRAPAITAALFLYSQKWDQNGKKLETHNINQVASPWSWIWQQHVTGAVSSFIIIWLIQDQGYVSYSGTTVMYTLQPLCKEFLMSWSANHKAKAPPVSHLFASSSSCMHTGNATTPQRLLCPQRWQALACLEGQDLAHNLPRRLVALLVLFSTMLALFITMQVMEWFGP